MRPSPNAPIFGIALGKAAAAIAAAAIGVGLLASCSSTAQEPDAGTGTTAAAGSDDAQTQIKQVTQDFITAFNTGKMTDVAPLVCSKLAYTASDGQDRPESVKKAQIDRFESIMINGDSATVRLAVSVIGDDTVPAKPVDMVVVNEGGWKICE